MEAFPEVSPSPKCVGLEFSEWDTSASGAPSLNSADSTPIDDILLRSESHGHRHRRHRHQHLHHHHHHHHRAKNHNFRQILDIIDPYLDVEAILLLRQCAHVFRRHVYRPYDNILDFSGFRGMSAIKIVKQILPLARDAVLPPSLENPPNLKLDLSDCTTIGDEAINALSALVRSDPLRLGLVSALKFDYCYQITDKGLKSMFVCPFPKLEYFSLNGARSNHLTGSTIGFLQKESWPMLTHFCASFTNIWLDHAKSLAEFVEARAAEFDQVPTLDLCGSWASRCLLEGKEPLRTLLRTFEQSMHAGDLDGVARSTKKGQAEWANLKDDSVLCRITGLHGAKLLVNVPMMFGDVWSLPISNAIESSNANLLRLLLKRGAEVNCWDHRRKAPLCWAAENGDAEIANVLLKNGASSVPHDLAGECALHAAIRNGRVEVSKIMLRHGALLNTRRCEARVYKSPLILACEQGSTNMVKLLLEFGADPNCCHECNMAPALVAYKANPCWLPLFLDAGAGALPHNRWVLTELLACTIGRNDLDAAKELVGRHPDLLHRRHRVWSTPHIQAARMGRSELLTYFVERGGLVDDADVDGNTALHASVMEGSLACIKYLISKKAKIDCINGRGQTPLHLACNEDRAEAAMSLVLAGANVNVQEAAHGETPLMTSIKTRHCEIANLIIKSSGSRLELGAADFGTRTALDYALQYNASEVTGNLLDAGAPANCNSYARAIARLHSDKKLQRKFQRLYQRGDVPDSIRPRTRNRRPMGGSGSPRQTHTASHDVGVDHEEAAGTASRRSKHPLEAIRYAVAFLGSGRRRATAGTVA